MSQVRTALLYSIYTGETGSRVKLSLTGGYNNRKIKTVSPKNGRLREVVAYYRGTNYSDLNDKILVNWKSGRCRETVAYRKGGSTVRFDCFHFPVSLRVLT